MTTSDAKLGNIPYILKNPKTEILHQKVRYDNINFHTARMQVSSDIELKGKIVLIHGWAEYIELYYRMMEFLTSIGYECFIYEQRGYGKTSEGDDRGRDSRNKDDVFKDLDKMIEIAFSLNKGVPANESISYSLYGHSMGGTIALLYKSKGKYGKLTKNIVTTCPLIETSPNVTPSIIKYTILYLVSYIQPYLKLSPNEGDKTGVTFCPKWLTFFESEDPNYNTGTVNLFKNIISRSYDLKELATSDEANWGHKSRLLVLQSENDMISNEFVTASFFDALSIKDKIFKSLKNSGHSIHLEKDEVFEVACGYVKAFLDRGCMVSN